MMKFLLTAIATLFALIQLPGSSYAELTLDQVNGILDGTISTAALLEPCGLLGEQIDYDDYTTAFKWNCLLKVVGDNGVVGVVIFPLEGIDIPTDSVDANGLQLITGQNSIFAIGMQVVQGPDHPCVLFPSGMQPIFSMSQTDRRSRSRRLYVDTEGNKDLLVVRVTDGVSTTSKSAAEISDSVFGTHGDPVNTASQYKACSHGKLNFLPGTQPANTSLAVIDGVVEVTSSRTIAGAHPITIINSALTEMLSHGFSAPGGFDNIMFCLPEGTAGDWLAYGWLYFWLSVYNDNWCTYVSAQMHEIGHNLGLHHSGEGNNEYGDQSGLMGYSYNYSDHPKMCFNGPKSWQLGWYDDRHTIVDPLSDCWDGDLVGLAEYGDSLDETVILKIDTSTATDYYVNFNRNTNMNDGTMEGADQVLITTQGREGSIAAQSYLLAKLNASSEPFEIPNFDGSGETVTITVDSISTPTSYTVANVKVSNGACPAPWVGGDPHFKTWAGERYDFHGICDLVLLQNHEFNDKLGMDIHIRTKKMKKWSHVSNAVLRIGEDRFEVMGAASGDGLNYWFNGAVAGSEEELTDGSILIQSISGYPILYNRLSTQGHQFTVDIGDDEKIVMRIWKAFVSVDIEGAKRENFSNSSGLMGTFPKGVLMARDGMAILNDFHKFGEEWQVRQMEPKLFHTLEEPQSPQRCIPPAVVDVKRRLQGSTVSVEQATIACSHVIDEMDRDLCIFDVMATGDLDVVGAY